MEKMEKVQSGELDKKQSYFQNSILQTERHKHTKLYFQGCSLEYRLITKNCEQLTCQLLWKKIQNWPFPIYSHHIAKLIFVEVQLITSPILILYVAVISNIYLAYLSVCGYFYTLLILISSPTSYYLHESKRVLSVLFITLSPGLKIGSSQF